MTAPVFRALDDVEYGRVDQVSPSIRRVIAENPSKFTYRGTGTYIVGRGDVVVIDPGPRLESHRQALTDALRGERVRAILITHCHADHSPLAAWLQDETGAPTFGFGPHPVPDPVWEELARPAADDSEPAVSEPVDTDPVEMEESTDYEFTPTVTVADGDVAVEGSGLTITAVHTPGHTSNHVCWAFAEERALFTGDHVMGWSTTVVAPPDGHMGDYIASLRRVAGRGDRMLWPTHGPPRDDAVEYVQALVDHRLERKRGVLAAIESGRATIPEIVALLYADVRVELHKAAAMSVWSHVLELVDEGAVGSDGPPALTATYHLSS
jgi:glyoxylase-like metal-dependent hydrolase (beta-lactamase superfamily II)